MPQIRILFLSVSAGAGHARASRGIVRYCSYRVSGDEDAALDVMEYVAGDVPQALH